MKLWKKVLSIALCASLLLCAMPLTAFAQQDEYKVGTLTVLGDSIAYGYGLDGVSPYPVFQDTYFCSPENSWPALTGKLMDTDNTFNMSILGAKATDYIKFLTDPASVSEMMLMLTLLNSSESPEDLAALLDLDLNNPSPALIKAYQDCQYHYVIVDAIKKADAVAIQLGGNDLIQGLLTENLTEMAYNETGEIKNPAALALLLAFTCFVSLDGCNIRENTVAVLAAVLAAYADQITAENLTEILNFFSKESMEAKLPAYADKALAAYRKIAELISKGMSLSKEEGDYILACYAQADALLPYASDDTEGGRISQKDLLANGRLELTEADGGYTVAPINPNADVSIVSLYNPYGNELDFSDQDSQELINFLFKSLILVSELIFGEATINTANLNPVLLALLPSELEVSQYETKLADTEAELTDIQQTEHKSPAITPAWANWTPGGKNAGVWFWHSYNPAQHYFSTHAVRRFSPMPAFCPHWPTPVAPVTPVPEPKTVEKKQVDVLAKLTELMRELPFMFLHYALGANLADAYSYYTDGLKALSEEYGFGFVDVTDMPSSRTWDFHPKEAGHALIAERTYAEFCRFGKNSGLLTVQSLNKMNRAPEEKETKLAQKTPDQTDEQLLAAAEAATPVPGTPAPGALPETGGDVRFFFFAFALSGAGLGILALVNARRKKHE